MVQATQTHSQTETEVILNKTDFGHIVYENRKLLSGLLITIMLAVTGYVFWKQNKASQAIKTSESVFNFQSSTWAEAKAGKIPASDLAKTFSGLESEVRNAPVMLPLVLEMGKFLFDKGTYTEAETILNSVETGKHPISAFFIGMQNVAILEKLGKTDAAIVVLENLGKNKDSVLPARISLELGRLYMQKGEKGKAQTQFENITTTYPNDEAAKMAKLYLSQLAQ